MLGRGLRTWLPARRAEEVHADSIGTGGAAFKGLGRVTTMPGSCAPVRDCFLASLVAMTLSLTHLKTARGEAWIGLKRS